MDAHFEAVRVSRLRGLKSEVEFLKGRIAIREAEIEELERELIINRVWSDRTEADLTNQDIHIREEEELM